MTRGERGNRVQRYRCGAYWLGSVLAVWLSVAAVVPAAAQTPATPKREVKPARADLTRDVGTLLEGYRALNTTLAEMREQMDALQRGMSGTQDEIRESRDLLQALLAEVKEMREEVRGLYVESSGLKGDIAQLGEKVEGLGGNLGSFRLNSGILLAVVLVLQLTLVALTFRGRGQ